MRSDRKCTVVNFEFEACTDLQKNVSKLAYVFNKIRETLAYKIHFEQKQDDSAGLKSGRCVLFLWILDKIHILSIFISIIEG